MAILYIRHAYKLQHFIRANTITNPETWMDCQGAWIYLEAIFASADIQRQLPQEAKMFNQVDKNFKEICRQAKKVALALPTMSSVEVFDMLKEDCRLLDLISRGLEAYLEVKRVVFPRYDLAPSKYAYIKFP